MLVQVQHRRAIVDHALDLVQVGPPALRQRSHESETHTNTHTERGRERERKTETWPAPADQASCGPQHVGPESPECGRRVFVLKT